MPVTRLIVGARRSWPSEVAERLKAVAAEVLEESLDREGLSRAEPVSTGAGL